MEYEVYSRVLALYVHVIYLYVVVAKIECPSLHEHTLISAILIIITTFVTSFYVCVCVRDRFLFYWPFNQLIMSLHNVKIIDPLLFTIHCVFILR